MLFFDNKKKGAMGTLYTTLYFNIGFFSKSFFFSSLPYFSSAAINSVLHFFFFFCIPVASKNWWGTIEN